MAALGLNSSGILRVSRRRSLLRHSASISSPSVTFSRPPFLHSTAHHWRFPRHRLNSISTPSIAASDEGLLDAEEEEEEVDPFAELRFLDPVVDPGSIGATGSWTRGLSWMSAGRRSGSWWCATPLCPCSTPSSSPTMSSIASPFATPSPTSPTPWDFPCPRRSQMQTIVSRACNEIGIKPIPSKRCISLMLWLEERYETVYTRHPGFQRGSKPLLALDNPFPMELPDNLFGDKWAFVYLTLEVSSFEKKYAFGGNLDLDLLGIEVDDKTLVPGLAVASSRAKPLAAWMNGLEVCSIEADAGRACLILSVVVSTRYVYATYKKNAATTQEAEAWEAAKKASGGLHFLAIQERLDSEGCVGFWLLLDLPPPPV